MSQSTQPVGFFDSGVGGTSIWKEVVRLLPGEDTVYLADSKNAPYGNRSKQEIIDLSVKNTEFLLGRNCKVIVIPCNTATTNAISYLRNHYQVPFIGIEPAIKPAALFSTSKKIGVLATRGTLSSALFNATQQQYAHHINMIEVTGTGIVELIEEGKTDSPAMTDLLTRLVEPFMISGIDYLVLGCSHYPYIKHHLEALLPNKVRIIDSGEAVARQVLKILQDLELLNTSSKSGYHQLFSNLDTRVLFDLTAGVNNRSVSPLDF
ncbi:MAG: glutamate racemase [Nonlabens sp.]